MSETEVEKMRREAEAHADEDQKRRAMIEARNTADNAVYTSEKTLKDLGDKVPADLKTRVEEAIKQVRVTRDQDDSEAINQSVEALMKVLQEVGQAAYQQPGNQTGAASEKPEDSAHDDGDFVDGEFRQA